MDRWDHLFTWIKSRARQSIIKVDKTFDDELLTWREFVKKVKCENYCVYQTEMLGKKLSLEYRKFLDNARVVYDFAQDNIRYYPRGIFMPLLFDEMPKLNNVNVNTIIFAGLLTNRRRYLIDILRENGLQVDFPTHHHNFNELMQLFDNYKYVLSCGAYDNNMNDSIRIIPAVENGNIVIAERREKFHDRYFIDECPDRIIFFNYDTIIKDITE